MSEMRLARFLERSSAALYLFIYRFIDLMPMLQPSVTRSATVLSVRLILKAESRLEVSHFPLRSDPDLCRGRCSRREPFAVRGQGSRFSFMLLSSEFFSSGSFTLSITSLIAVTPIFTPASHSRSSLIVSRSIINKTSFCSIICNKEVIIRAIQSRITATQKSSFLFSLSKKL